MLNLFMFNQELYFRKREHVFIEKFRGRNLGCPFRIKGLNGYDEAT